MSIKLGDWLHYLIQVVTLGQGKKIASYIAKKMGYEDCGCDSRRQWLNNLFKKDEDKIFYL